ncbi:MAG: peptide chain release factor N(5)-glutamine methyltransferase [Bacilli bacterium]
MKIRELYFQLKELDNEYLNDRVIKELFSFCLNISFNELPFHFDDEIKKENIDKIDKYLYLIKDGYPIQYITNNVSFCSLNFYVDERVLIPRNETEELVEISKKLIKERFKDKKINIFDVCSGSGVIGLSLKDYFKNSNVYLFDISLEAIEVSKINALNNKLEVNIIKSDCLEYPLKNNLNADVIISNPPYIFNRNTVDKNVNKYEPSIALYCSNPIEFYERIILKGMDLLNDNGLFAFEIEDTSVNDLEIFLKNNLSNNMSYIFKKDMYNKYRFLFIFKN